MARKEKDLSTVFAASPAVKAQVSLISGGFSSLVSCVLLQPFDVIKTISQTPGNRQNMFAIYRNVSSKRGHSALWRGLVPTIIRTVPGVGMYFSSLQLIRSVVPPAGEFGQYTPLQTFMCGAGARILVACLLMPLTVVKTRVESGLYQYRGVFQGLAVIARREGIRGLFSGAIPTALRDSPFSGLYLLFYSQTQIVLREASVPSFVANMSSGFLGGICASVLTQPQDVVKTRMQLSPNTYPRVLPTTWAIIKEDGVRGLFAGVGARIVRRTLMASITWAIYEEISPWLTSAIVDFHRR